MINKTKSIIKKITPRFLINAYHFILAYLGVFLYGFPSRKMVIIGVVGTRGKTTTANFIWSCLNAAGYKVGLTSTANIRIGEKEMLNPYHMTMPGRFVLQKLLYQMRKVGCQYAVIETPSEGVEQWRHKGINYDIAVFTTWYPEYLEVHNWNAERCKQMNMEIFASLKNQKIKKIGGKKIPKIIVVNNDSPDRELFLQFPADKKTTYAISSKADFVAKNIKVNREGVNFSVNSIKYQLNILGEFNVYNALAAIALASALDIDKKSIKKGLKNLNKVPGRMEKIEKKQPFLVFVDYAHDVVSLNSILDAVKYLKKRPSNRIILLLGAEGGGRDKTKRPLMGEVAAKKADIVIVSNVDPYDDNPTEIVEDIAKACDRTGKTRWKDLFVIEDREMGIRQALAQAEKDDIVLITGKGAEQMMIIEGKKIPWDDRKIVEEILTFDNQHNQNSQ